MLLKSLLLRGFSYICTDTQKKREKKSLGGKATPGATGAHRKHFLAASVIRASVHPTLTT